VEADAPYRTVDLSYGSAVAVDRPVRGQLSLVESADVDDGALQRIQHLRVDARRGGVALVQSHTDILEAELGAVDLFRVVAQGLVAPLPHVVDDAPDGRDVLGELRPFPERAAPHGAGNALLSACVDDLERHR
jgi:hypothetical protein